MAPAGIKDATFGLCLRRVGATSYPIFAQCAKTN